MVNTFKRGNGPEIPLSDWETPKMTQLREERAASQSTLRELDSKRAESRAAENAAMRASYAAQDAGRVVGGSLCQQHGRTMPCSHEAHL